MLDSTSSSPLPQAPRVRGAGPPARPGRRPRRVQQVLDDVGDDHHVGEVDRDHEHRRHGFRLDCLVPPKPRRTATRTTTFDSAPPMCIDAGKTYTATFDTTAGSFTVKLDPKTAPIATNNFVFLARNHYYDGVTFHRIIPGFVIQGGDANGNPPGTGTPGYSFADELPSSASVYQPGLLRHGEPRTGHEREPVLHRARGRPAPAELHGVRGRERGVRHHGEGDRRHGQPERQAQPRHHDQHGHHRRDRGISDPVRPGGPRACTGRGGSPWNV